MALGCIGFFRDVFHRGKVKERRSLMSLLGKKGGVRYIRRRGLQIYQE
jgi:hypothetical protein